MCRFKIGDVVEVVVDHPDGNEFIYPGMIGIVRDIQTYASGYCRVGVEFYEYVAGHSLRDGYEARCENGYGWYVEQSDIKICRTQYTNNEEYEFDEDSFRRMLE